VHLVVGDIAGPLRSVEYLVGVNSRSVAGDVRSVNRVVRPRRSDRTVASKPASVSTRVQEKSRYATGATNRVKRVSELAIERRRERERGRDGRVCVVSSESTSFVDSFTRNETSFGCTGISQEDIAAKR